MAKKPPKKKGKTEKGKKKPSRKRAQTYEPKLKVTGTFIDLINIAVGKKDKKP